MPLQLRNNGSWSPGGSSEGSGDGVDRGCVLKWNDQDFLRLDVGFEERGLAVTLRLSDGAHGSCHRLRWEEYFIHDTQI